MLDGFDGASNVYQVVTARNISGGAVLDGFAVTGGHANGDSQQTRRGAGIINVSATLTLRNLLVTGNRASQSGGRGSGLLTSQSHLTIEDSFFVDNLEGQGTLFADENAVVSISRTLFSGNSTDGSGAGIYAAKFSQISLADSAFVENFSGARGGGIYADDDATLRLDRVGFYGNGAGTAGAGIAITEHASLVAVNSAFVGNTVVAEASGGAVSIEDQGRAVLTACTVAANVALGDGGGIAVSGEAQITVQDSLLLGNLDVLNTPPLGGGNTSAQQLYIAPGSSALATVGYSVVEGGFPGPNISDDPLFMRPPDAGDGNWGTPDDNDFGDLRLRAGSPAIDAGDNTADLDASGEGTETIADVATDLAGGPRLLDDPATADTGIGSAPIVDIGAYEYSPPLFADGFESGDTSAWSLTVD